MINRRKMNRRSAVKRVVALSIGAVLGGGPASDLYVHGPSSPEVPPEGSRFSLHNVSIAVDPSEPAFVQHAARDLSEYLREITGAEVPIQARLEAEAPSLVVVGAEMARRLDPALLARRELGKEGFLIKRVSERGKARLNT